MRTILIALLLLAHLSLESVGSASATGRSLEITSPARLVAPHVVSSEFNEIRLATSPDGRTMIWGSTNRPGGPGRWDLWMSRRGRQGWSAPTPAPFDSDSNDFDPSFSPDGRFVYFFSNRLGGFGGDDLWRVPVVGGRFGTSENLGPEVNSAGDEWAPTVSPDGRRLLFATNGRGGRGRHDLFVATPRSGGWAAAEPLPGDINTPGDEFDASYLHDRSSIVFSRSPDADDEPILLYFAACTPSGYDAGTVLSDSVNVVGGYTLGPSITRTRPGILYFSGHRLRPSAGRMDVYEVRYRVR
jgi:TolB protein